MNGIVRLQRWKSQYAVPAGRFLVILIALNNARGQDSNVPRTSPSVLPSFAAASIRQARSDRADDAQWSPPGTGNFIATNVPLGFLIRMAFGIDESQIVWQPKWNDSGRYDVTAKPEEGIELTRDQLKPRLQALLEQRFGLVLHHETRSVPGYVLIVGKHGPHLQTSIGDHPPGFRVDVGPGRLEGLNWSMPFCASMLTPKVGRPVVDNTGLMGSYDITVRYAPDDSPDSLLPSLYTALKETLGLQLSAKEVQADVVVIDSLSKVPTPN